MSITAEASSKCPIDRGEREKCDDCKRLGTSCDGNDEYIARINQEQEYRRQPEWSRNNEYDREVKN